MMFRTTHLRDSAHPILVFGLDARDMRRLYEGEPLTIKCDAMGVDCDVVIMAGVTVEVIAQRLAEAIEEASHG